MTKTKVFPEDSGEDEGEFYSKSKAKCALFLKSVLLFEHYIRLLLLHFAFAFSTARLGLFVYFFSSLLVYCVCVCLCVGVSYNLWQFVFLLYSKVFGLLR